MRSLPLILLLTACAPAFGQDAGSILARKIANARPGETITVAPGSYGSVTLNGVRFQNSVRVVANGARLSGLVLSDVAGIDWRGGTIVGPGGRSYGIKVTGSKRVRFEGLTIRGAHRGVVIDRSEDIALVGNTLTALISDGIDIALSRRVRIERNTCRDFNPTPAIYDAAGKRLKDGDHPDCIQAWSRPTAPPTADLTIVNNDIQGNMQGIFLGNHVRNGVDDGGFDRILIRGNRINVSTPIGITLGSGRASLITGNEVRTIPGSMLPNKPVAVKASIRVTHPGTTACNNVVTAVPSGIGTGPCPTRQ